MKFLKFKHWRARDGMLLATALMLASCGNQTRPGSRDGTMSSGAADASAGHSEILEPEEVVLAMENADQLPLQPASVEDLATRQKSLIPLDQVDRSGQALLLDGANLLSLDGATDGREVVDLRSNDTGIRNQGSRGWCTAFATIAAMENLSNRFYKTSLDLSEIHHFQSYNQYATPPSLSKAKSLGIIDEAQWPYNGKKQPGADSKIRARLQQNHVIQFDLTHLVESVRAGFPVVINLDVNSSFMQPREGGIISPGGRSQGGHAIAVTGIVIDARVGGGGYFVIKNSWGASWGDHGYGYLPFTYCQSSSCYAWSITDLSVYDDSGRALTKVDGNSEPTPTPAPTPAPTVSPQPTASPNPNPTPVPTVEPADNISVESFKAVWYQRNYRAARGVRSYVMMVNADNATLQKVQSITYKVEGRQPFVSSSRSSNSVNRADFMSNLYRIGRGDSQSAEIVVLLKDGRSFTLPTLTIEN